MRRGLYIISEISVELVSCKALDPFAFRNDLRIMPLCRSFVPFSRRVWMCEIYQRIRQILELGEPGEFRTIVCRDRLEHLREMLTIFLPNRFECFQNGGCFPVYKRDHPVLPALALCQSQQNFILPRVLADDKVAFPMSEFFPVVDGRIPLFDAATEFLFVLPIMILFRSAGCLPLTCCPVVE
jgi:hypothetical protein